MKKTLLLSAVALCTSLSSSAFEVGEYVYAPQGRFMITGSENLCANGSFVDATGWTAFSATEGMTADQLFTYNPETQAFNSGTNIATEGMYYKFSIPNPAGSYVVSLKMRKESAAEPYSTNVTATEAEGVMTFGNRVNGGKGYNFLNVYGNSGGAYDSATDYVSFGKGVQLTQDWTTYSFAIVGDGTARDWYITLAGMDATIEIKDIQIQEAEQYANLQQRDEVVGYLKAIVGAKEWEASDALAGVEEIIVALEEGITAESSQTDLNDILSGASEVLNTADKTGFFDTQMDDVLAICAEGSKFNNRDTSEKNGKFQRQSKIGDWVFTPAGRGFNQDGADLTGIMSPDWVEAGHYMYGNAVGTGGLSLTRTLSPGVYVFSMDCSAGTRYDKSETGGGWTYNMGFTPFSNKLYVKDATGTLDSVVVDVVPTDSYKQNYMVFTIEKAGEYTIGTETYVREDAYIGSLGKVGAGFFFKSPVLYCKLFGNYNAEELQYIADVKTQIEALRSNLDNAKALLDDATYPWLKNELADTIAKYEAIYAQYPTNDDVIYQGFLDPVLGKENNGYASLSDGPEDESGKPTASYEAYDVVMNYAVRPVKRFMEKYEQVNSVFSDLQSAIDAAEVTLANVVYSTSTGADNFKTAIATAKETYKVKAAEGVYNLPVVDGTTGESVEQENPDYDAVVAAKETLVASEAEYIASVPAESYTTVAEIDFENPAVYDEENKVWTIAGNGAVFNAMSNFSETNTTGMTYAKGFDSNGETLLPGVLRIGNSEGTIDIDPSICEGKIIRVSFDYYFGNLTKRETGFNLKDADGNKILEFKFCPYNHSETTPVNALGFDLNKIPGIGKGGQDNAAICVESNLTHFEIILNYIQGKMSASTFNSNKGNQTTAEVELTQKFAQFATVSNYNVDTRRSWFDNFKVETIAVSQEVIDGVDGVKEVGSVANGAIYNVAGQKVANPVKGQIYIKNGAAFVK